MQNNTWLFLNTGFCDAFTNMAIDETLSLHRDQNPVLRVFGWKPFAISLGHYQDENDINFNRCNEDNIDVVKRPTGGRAIFHAEEVTYSVVIPKISSFYEESTLSIYNTISKALLHGLNLVGIDAELQKKSTFSNEKILSNIPCFASSAKYEITYKGKKLVGSAQRRFENAVLQHGSILLGPKHLEINKYINFKDNIEYTHFTNLLIQKTISISQILMNQINFNKIVKSIKRGFIEVFNINFLNYKLTPQEQNEVKKLINKYNAIRRKRK